MTITSDVLSEGALRESLDIVKKMANYVGFTGTQAGMTLEQYNTVGGIVKSLAPKQGHHGDCIGADAQFHNICRNLGVYIVGHPGIDFLGKSPKRAFCDVDECEPELPYLERNENIVEACKTLIAAPKEFVEVLRSGTWSTVRKARKKNRVLYIVLPDGTLAL